MMQLNDSTFEAHWGPNNGTWSQKRSYAMFLWNDTLYSKEKKGYKRITAYTVDVDHFEKCVALLHQLADSSIRTRLMSVLMKHGNLTKHEMQEANALYNKENL